MPNLKISAMPGLGTGAAPGDLLTVVDVSAPAATANKHVTLNNFLSVITRGITDHAVRFTPPGSPPAVSLAAQGSIYFDGSNFQISANGGAYAPLLSLSPQADHAVLIGPTSGGPTAPTWRGLALSDLPAIATNRLLGRVSPGSGDVEEITPGAGILTWLQTPTSANLFSALTTKQGIGGDVVFSQAPSFQGLTSTTGMTLVGTLSAGGTLSTATAQIVFTGVSTGPFSCLEIRNATTGAVPVITVNSGSTNYGLEIASKGNSTLTLKGNTVSISNNIATAGGTIEARGGSGSGGGGSVRLYERSTNGTNYWSWLAPDSLSVSVVQELPDGYGNPGDGLISNGFGVMSWAPLVKTNGGQTVEFGAGSVSAPSITTSGDTDTGLYFPSANVLGLASNSTLCAAVVSSDFIIGNTITHPFPAISQRGLVIPRIGNSEIQLYAAKSTGAAANSVYRNTVSGGTLNSPTATEPGQSVILGIFGHNGAGFNEFVSGGIRMRAPATWSSTSNPSEIGIETTPINGINSSGVIDRAVRIFVGNDGRVGVGTTTPTNLLDINSSSVRLRTADPPTSISATGNQGEIRWGNLGGVDYLFLATGTNTWRRVALSAVPW